MIATIPALAAVIGALMYALSSNTKLSEIGRLVFFAGILALLLSVHAGSVRVLP
jgi:Na+/phosphate symporter